MHVDSAPQGHDATGSNSMVDERDSGAGGQNVSADQDALLPGHEARRFDLPVRAETRRVDAVEDGWQTEAFSAVAARRLKALAKEISHSELPSPERLAGYVSEAFGCGALRPELVDVYRDSSLVVRRADPDSQVDGASSGQRFHEGPAGFRAALQALLSPLPVAGETRMSVKLFSVEPSDDAVATRAYIQLTGRAEGESVQQNATWICHWEAVATNRPLLTAVDVEQYEEIATTAGKVTLFRDCTAAVLGACPSYDQQLVYGVDHWRRRIETTLAPHYTALNGVSVGDVNGDGLDDVYLCQGQSLPNRLFIQQPDGSARDTAEEAGVNWLDHCDSALIIDLDNDGDQDLVVGTDASLLLHDNDGGGHFEFRGHVRFPTDVDSMTAADYDGDGR